MSGILDSLEATGEGASSPGSWRTSLRRAALCLCVSIGTLPLLWGAIEATDSRVVAAIGFTGTAVASLAGAWFACVTISRAASARPPKGTSVGLGGAALLVVHGGMALLGMFAALLSTAGGRGRQLRRFGRVLLPRLVPGSDWSRGVEPIAIDGSSRAGVAAQWRENARTEHASVGAFAGLTMDLLALGAPPDLLASAQRDGLDEVRHAQMCLGLAAGIDGVDRSPASFPAVRSARALPRTRVLALARLAVDSLVDGVLHEGVSARMLARLARVAEVAQIRETLTELAADEGRHAAHAWHVVQWCIREGGAPVAHALLGATRALAEHPQLGVTAAARDGAWERWGIPGRSLEEEEYAAARANVVRRVDTLAGGFMQTATRAA